MPDTTTNLRDGHSEVLVRAAKSGASSAWSAVFQRYERMLRGHVRTMVARHRGRIEAEELVQATFAQAWRQIQSFEYQGEGSFRRWLRQVAKGLYVNEVRDRGARREESLSTEVISGTVDERERDLGHTLHERLSLDEAMAELSEDDREILLMSSDEGLNLHQIAGILECSHKQAGLRLAAAMRHLQQRLEGRQK